MILATVPRRCLLSTRPPGDAMRGYARPANSGTKCSRSVLPSPATAAPGRSTTQSLKNASPNAKSTTLTSRITILANVLRNTPGSTWRQGPARNPSALLGISGIKNSSSAVRSTRLAILGKPMTSKQKIVSPSAKSTRPTSKNMITAPALPKGRFTTQPPRTALNLPAPKATSSIPT